MISPSSLYWGDGEEQDDSLTSPTGITYSRVPPPSCLRNNGSAQEGGPVPGLRIMHSAVPPSALRASPYYANAAGAGGVGIGIGVGGAGGADPCASPRHSHPHQLLRGPGHGGSPPGGALAPPCSPATASGPLGTTPAASVGFGRAPLVCPPPPRKAQPPPGYFSPPCGEGAAGAGGGAGAGGVHHHHHDAAPAVRRLSFSADGGGVHDHSGGDDMVMDEATPPASPTAGRGGGGGGGGGAWLSPAAQHHQHHQQQPFQQPHPVQHQHQQHLADPRTSTPSCRYMR